MKKIETTGNRGLRRIGMAIFCIFLLPMALGACAANGPIRAIDSIAPADVRSIKDLRNTLGLALIQHDDALTDHNGRLGDLETKVEALEGRVNTLEVKVEAHEATNRKAFTDLTAAVQRVGASTALAMETTDVGGQIIRVLPAFPEGSSILSTKQECFLDTAVADATQPTPTVKWGLVRGYASTTGSATKNAELAQARADAVQAYLATRGITVVAEAPDPAKTNYRRTEAVLYGTKP